MPQSALRKGAADVGLTLARELSARAQRLEGAAAAGPAGPGDPAGPGGASGAPRVMPDAGVFAVGDQLSVATHDVALALAAAPADEAVPVLAECVALVRDAARAL
ncbi:hypothetical protein [Streptomyces iconiensis]|uniref:Uncharacterized protein n=1 Tax=Streptomyces iconiensis TaxID=1384038 RepID=A0ABT7A7T2_9ACTN|nr:hypothetical protein [Streptomyces iconiensis]MDJ1137361.1 hypothetical protein [Streptomyces iconiensis]